MRKSRWAAAAAVAAVVLSACSSATPAPTQAAGIVVSDPWIKAADSGMTAAFAVLENTGGGEARLVSVASPASTLMEIHEITTTADGNATMRPKDGGVTIAGHSSHLLEPGGDHLMLMELTEPITTGTEVEFTLTFADGSTTEFTAPARDFVGNNEEYQPGHGSEPAPMDGASAAGHAHSHGS